jgi:hypothetical protein
MGENGRIGVIGIIGFIGVAGRIGGIPEDTSLLLQAIGRPVRS